MTMQLNLTSTLEFYGGIKKKGKSLKKDNTAIIIIIITTEVNHIFSAKIHIKVKEWLSRKLLAACFQDHLLEALGLENNQQYVETLFAQKSWIQPTMATFCVWFRTLMWTFCQIFKPSVTKIQDFVNKMHWVGRYLKRQETPLSPNVNSPEFQ